MSRGQNQVGGGTPDNALPQTQPRGSVSPGPRLLFPEFHPHLGFREVYFVGAEFDWARCLYPAAGRDRPKYGRDQEIIEARRAGLTYRQIADCFGIGVSRVQAIFGAEERRVRFVLSCYAESAAVDAERSVRIDLGPHGVGKVMVAIDMLLEGEEKTA